MIRSCIILCLAVAVSSLPQSGSNLCGSDERGVARVAGDTWQEDCNRCRCTDNLLPGCTKRFCGAFPGPPPPTTSQPTSSAPRTGGIKFPGDSRAEQTTVKTVSCTDQSGKMREVGESWAEDCNQCRCGNKGIASCTHRFCINVEEFKKDKFLFTVDSTKNTEEIVQCSSEGAQNCKAVTLNSEHLSSASTTDSQFLKLLEGSEVELQLVRGPADLSSDSHSYVFRLRDGGEGILTVRQSTSTAYGTFKPTSGSVHYNVEACKGNGCNVIFERDSNFFNNFED